MCLLIYACSCGAYIKHKKVIDITPLWRKSELLDAEDEFVFLFISSSSNDSSGFAHTGLYAYKTKYSCGGGGEFLLKLEQISGILRDLEFPCIVATNQGKAALRAPWSLLFSSFLSLSS